MKPKLIAKILELHQKQKKRKRLTEEEKFLVYLVDHCQALEKQVEEQKKELYTLWRLRELATSFRSVFEDIARDVNA